MAALRTDYIDDVFTGNRKYRMVNNADGTVSFVDVTEYVQTGDTYGAAEINAQNDAINKAGINVSDVSIPVAERNAGAVYFFY